MVDDVITEQVVSFVLDGREVQGRLGETIIQVADREGVYIPRFCYHERLSIAANCRMCLVQVNQGDKTLPACHAQIAEGMEVQTQSKATKHSQKSIMEFLLINHPLDCPICDQGGQCELQDLAMGFGRGVSRYAENKRAVADENLGSLVATDMTRCIHCTRCVRFGTEIAGIPELGAPGRGEDMRIQTYLEHGLQSELSGNCIDLCPVGALTSKPLRYQGRSWSFKNHAYHSAHDALLSSVHVHTYDNGLKNQDKVMRVVPRQCDAVNQSWISDRDRFSYLGLSHEQRLSQPMLRDGKEWKSVTWDAALTFVAEKIQSVLKEFGPEQIGALISPNATIEEGYICQKLLHTLGCNNMDYRHHQIDTDYIDSSVDVSVNHFMNFSELEQSQCVLLVGSYLRHEQPIAAMRVRQAAKKGLKVLSINPVAYDWNFSCTKEEVVSGVALLEFLGACLLSLQSLGVLQLSNRWRERLSDVKRSRSSDQFAKILSKGSGYIILGHYAQSHPYASTIYRLCEMIGAVSQMRLIMMNPGVNATGLHTIGFGPFHRVNDVRLSTGESSYQMIDKQKKLYLLQQVEPEYDHYDPSMALNALHKAKAVISITSYVTDRMLEYADVLLPAAMWTEFSGTWVSAVGQINSFKPIKSMYGSSKSVWKIYRVLGNLLKCEGFSYHDISELRSDISLLKDGLIDGAKQLVASEIDPPQERNFPLGQTVGDLHRIGEVSLYRVDPLVRRSVPLQEQVPTLVAKMNPLTLAKQGFVDGDKVRLKQGRRNIVCTLVFDRSIALGGVWLPSGVRDTVLMAGRHDHIVLEKIVEEEG